MSILQEKLKSIANAIREKLGTTELIVPNDFASKIDDVYNAGKQAEQDRFWDEFQNYGERTGYSYAFYSTGFDDLIYNPKYPIILTGKTSAGNMYAYNTIITDTKVDIIFSGSDISTNMMFYGATKLKTIKKIVFNETTQIATNTFTNTSNLENLTVEGVIAQSLYIHYSTKITHDSIMSVINHLKDYSGSGTTYTLNLGENNLAKLTDTEKAVATQKGWTLA